MSEFKTNKISPRKGTTQTIGDSGDTLSIASGVTVTNAGTITTAGISGGTINNSGGTISGLAGVVEWDTTAKTTAFTAEANKGYFCNTTSAAFTVTLPASPTAGDVIAIKDYANTFDTNKLELNANGNKIDGSTTNFDITVEGANSQFIYVDATRGWVLTDVSKASDIAEQQLFITATGGTITCCGDYKIHTFTGPGTFCVSCSGNAAGSNTVDYLVIAGAGSGGNYGARGGGGAGGYRESSGAASGCYTASPLGACVSALPVTVTGYPITVGAGGTVTVNQVLGGKGSDSVFSTITSAGGGAGFGTNPGCTPFDGNGGSGGAGVFLTPAGIGNTPPVSPPQGNPGGLGAAYPALTASGGGGAGAAGNGGTPSSGGPGGCGSTSSINASPTTRGGGGGGGTYGATRGAGGPGGGGYGAQGPSPAQAGTANTGGGGGGAGSAPTVLQNNGANGGSGIVIIRYKYQ